MDGSGANSGNRTSIGVEICYSKSGGERYKKAEALGIKFIAQFLHEYEWGVNRVKRHQEWSGKYCPHRVLQEGRWNEIVQRIQSELNALQGETPVTQSGPAPSPTAPTLLKRGDAETYVKGLQGKLQSLGFNIGKYGIDGQYGLSVDGIASPLTLDKLDQVYKAAQQSQEKPAVSKKEESLKEAYAMKMCECVGDYQMNQLETIYREARQDKLLKDERWEKKVADKSITVGEVAFLDAILVIV